MTNMLTKFESKSSRVKGVSFHPKRPWLLCSLHNGTIQLWDFRIGALLNRFEEHDGPVRAVHFHPSRRMFASGGDDYKIRVWNFKHVLYTLNGHLDYVRTVEFHSNDLPWILSCSDDQTIRIWNWQSRNCLAILTGHNHYVMCATWHPKDDLIASASLDQTVRVWDYSGLRKRHSAPQNSASSFEEQMLQRTMHQQTAQASDVFGNADTMVKYVLEGHDRGVNWVSFHPSLPLLVSAGDDRLIKIWRMSETKAWEVDTCRGHFSNASAALFHRSHDLILSVGEDKTIRVWDANKRTALQSFRRENDRFWIIAAHPTINLFAAGHDNGVMVFKLERERPAYTMHQGALFFVTKDKFVRSYDLQASLESSNLISLRKLGQAWESPRSISYNPADNSVLVSSVVDGGTYELINLPRDGRSLVDGSEAKRGSGSSVVWVARNRFAVFSKDKQTIDIKDLNNSVTRTIKPPNGVMEIHYGGSGNLLLCTQNQVILYDVQKKEIIAEITTPYVKYVYWSGDNTRVALLGKHTITVATKNLDQICSIHETIRIKSAVWDDTLGVLLYSTLNHVKYLIPNQGAEDTGVICTLRNTVYLIQVRGTTLTCLTREAKCDTITIDPTEYRFKAALANKEYKEMMHIIKTSSLVGQSIIGYLQKKGYSEIALQFVQEPQTQFELAIECGNLSVAVKTARELDKPYLWKQLAEAALLQGDISIVELAYQKLKDFDKLSFLYLAIGDNAKLAKMGKIAEHRGNFESQFQHSLWTGDIDARIRIFTDLNLHPLAYATAKTYGLAEVCTSILTTTGLADDQIKPLSVNSHPTIPPRPICPSLSNWPLLPTSPSLFEKAAGGELGNGEGVSSDYTEHLIHEKGPNGIPPSMNVDDMVDGDSWGVAEENTGGWEIEEEEAEIGDAGVLAIPAQGVPDAEIWVHNSPLAADHVAAGSFETALQLLARQVGLANPEPLKPKFLQIYQASRTFLSAESDLRPLEVYVRRSQVDRSRSLPRLPWNFEHIKGVQLREAFKLVTANKLEEAVVALREVLHTLLLFAASSTLEADEIVKTVETVREYIVGLSVEVQRRTIDTSSPEGVKRNLELAAYFTNFQLLPQHRGLAYTQAMMQFNKFKNIAMAGVFAQKYIALGIGKPDAVERAKKIMALAQRNTRDTVEIEYDQSAPFSVCAASYTPIYKGSQCVSDPFTGALYKPEFKGQLCRVSGVTEIGASATGYRVLI